MIIGLEHVGIATHSITALLPLYEQILGLKLETSTESKDHGIQAAVFSVGETKIELIEPLERDSAISKFIEKRGQGIHHIAFRVDNMEKMLEQLKEQGIALIDEHPRAGLEGGKMAFLHPKSTGNVLIELCEH
jgi:methylmalonyl-CoA/ethylmalonyl-CoA epimerase